MNLSPGDKLTKMSSPCQLFRHNPGSRKPDPDICEEMPALGVMVTKSVSGLPWHRADGSAAQDVAASTTEMKWRCGVANILASYFKMWLRSSGFPMIYSDSW